MISGNLSEAEEYLISLSELNNGAMGVSNGYDSSSDEVEFIQELKVTLDRHECDLCCRGTFLVDKLLRFGGLEGKFACEVCMTSFKSKAKAVAHARQHETEYGVASPVICCKTGASVLESVNVTEFGAGSKEIESNKKSPLATEKSFSCGKCPKQYKSASGLRKHRSNRHCNIMQSGCISEAVKSAKRARTESVISIEEPLVFVCDRCQEKFNTKKELKKHKDQCQNCDTASEPLACNVTREVSSTPVRNLQTNNPWIGAMKINTDAFADGTLAVFFSCGSCQETFSSQKKLKQHYTTHHGQSRDSIVSKINSESRESIISIADGNVERRESILSVSSNGESSTMAMQNDGNIFQTTPKVKKKMSAVAMQNSSDISETSRKCRSESGTTANSNQIRVSEYWSCDFCLIRCKSEKGLKKHNTLQHGPTYFCYLCGTSFKSSTMFRKHQKHFSTSGNCI
ncbi:hypothetical protein JTE90_017365 [Oedothorax gibbosus]|uniref:C2H2-type domain-containing protein n=1 Tax=Oedothorax gibbosus TaxID=931172 RepID=A0AAV6VPJ2_9ARAC|nr:hypothetical protein JTE90_017365 [Oedothorax gibbosus]